MKSHRHPWLLLSLALLTATAFSTGCGRGTSPTAAVAKSSPPTAQVATDVAQHFAVTLSRQKGVPIDRVGNLNLQTVARDGTAAARSLRAGSTLDDGEFSWSLKLVFYDEAGNEQPTYIPGLTARVQVTARVRGSVTSAEHRASIGIFRFLDVRGLLPAETELHADGAAHDTAHCAFDATNGSVSRRYDLLSAGSLEDLRQLKDASVNPYPLSGVLRWQVDIDAFEQDPEGEKEAHYDATVTVTFNGTRYPTIEVEERWRFRMDLETGEITPLAA